jgi:hypothetical protein
MNGIVFYPESFNSRPPKCVRPEGRFITKRTLTTGYSPAVIFHNCLNLNHVLKLLIAFFPCRHGRTTVIAPFPGLKGRAAARKEDVYSDDQRSDAALSRPASNAASSGDSGCQGGRGR